MKEILWRNSNYFSNYSYFKFERKKHLLESNKVENFYILQYMYRLYVLDDLYFYTLFFIIL